MSQSSVLTNNLLPVASMPVCRSVRVGMELMMEFKDGKHLSWDPDAIINEYHAMFPDPPVSSPEMSPTVPQAKMTMLMWTTLLAIHILLDLVCFQS